MLIYNVSAKGRREEKRSDSKEYRPSEAQKHCEKWCKGWRGKKKSGKTTQNFVHQVIEERPMGPTFASKRT